MLSDAVRCLWTMRLKILPKTEDDPVEKGGGLWHQRRGKQPGSMPDVALQAACIFVFNLGAESLSRIVRADFIQTIQDRTVQNEWGLSSPPPRAGTCQIRHAPFSRRAGIGSTRTCTIFCRGFTVLMECLRFHAQGLEARGASIACSRKSHQNLKKKSQSWILNPRLPLDPLGCGAQMLVK